MRKKDKVKLIVLVVFVASIITFLLTDNSASRTASAFSAGPPPGHTGAPGEFTCSECHSAPDAGTGQFTINAPPTYVPGQTYQITVNHNNSTDPTRRRWGFQLTALADDNTKAGNLQSLDAFTQILNNAGPGNSRQYIQHTSLGTFNGQQGSASWTFNWTAPATNVGTVTFYAAGNQANGDGNTSGDNIYFTFISAAPGTASPDFSVSATPSSQTVLQGNSTTYNVTVTPSGNFTGQVALSVGNLPSGASASFNPSSVTINDASSKSSTLTVTTNASTPVGTYQLTVTGTSGGLQRTASVSLTVASPTSADLAISKTGSPNPATVGMSLTYRITVTNNGPAAATGVTMTDTLPSGVTLVSITPAQGTCGGAGTVICTIGNLSGGSSTTITVIVTPTAIGTITNTANVSGNEIDPNTSNNLATLLTSVEAPAASPAMLDPNLRVRTLATGLNSPTSMAFLNASNILILEKSTGKVQRIVNGIIQSVALDLAVNNASERGLLGIALHPNFLSNNYVYLYWTESSTGVDTSNVDEVPLLGNRVDRYIWNGSALTFDRNLIRLRAFQADAGQPSRGNHNGGVLRFGADGKLYILMGDNGRRGLLQNITSGGPVPDDQFGGPEPDDAHLAGVILRLNDDGSTPSDNPFFTYVGANAANIQKIYAYGIRNGFGMAFDPLSGNLWMEENGDDSFDEINRVVPGFNGGWVQTMGPVSRIAEYKSIEMSRPGGLQQLRWPPTLIADTPAQALSRLYMLPSSIYADPEFSWKFAVAPSPIGFVRGQALGTQFEGDLFVGASRTTLVGGYLFRFNLTADRRRISVDDPRLTDRVADNSDKFDIKESESLLIGRDFGITTDIQTGPNGNLYIVSLSNGAIYEIYAQPPTLFTANLNGAQEVPPTNSPATGIATVLLSPDEATARVSLNFAGLSSAQTDAHIHGPAAPGSNGPVLSSLPRGSFNNFQIMLTPAQVQNLKAGLLYVNVHSANFPAGEIRGQINSSTAATSLQFSAASYRVDENEGSALITVNRFGNTAGAATVNFATSNGTASDRTDYSLATGTLRFAAGETSKSFIMFLTDDAYDESDETVNLGLSSPTGGALLGSPSTATLMIVDDDPPVSASNPIDEAQFFVRQHYLDFLNREPDAGGLNYWTAQITLCGNNQSCLTRRRAEVSAAFFIEREFQDTGSFIYRFYKASYGQRPTYAQFMSDRGRVIGGTDLEIGKQQFATEWVQRPEFTTRYPLSLDGPAFVDAIIQTIRQGSNVDLTSRHSSLINDFQAGGRALVMRRVADDSAFQQAEYDQAFVLMQYFGYLRRDPDAGGYNFWLDVLNNRVPGNYRAMVCAFITSREYQERFSLVVTRTNQDCSVIP